MNRVLMLALATVCASAMAFSQAAGADDAPLQETIDRQLSANPAFAGVHAKAHNGKVELTGSVATKQDRYHAEDLVKAVPGVTGVKDHLRVTTGQASSPSQPNPNGVAASTSPATGSGSSGGAVGSGNTGDAGGTTTNRAPNSNGSRSSGDQGAAPQGDASNPHLQLVSAGSVAQLVDASWQEPNPTSSQTSNAGAVHSGASAGQTPGSAHSEQSDSELQSRIQGSLRNEPTLSGSQVAVAVRGGTIELTGGVPGPKEKLTAERLARSYAVDRKVENKLMVAGQSASEPTPSGKQ